jgi:hypothetical protein
MRGAECQLVSHWPQAHAQARLRPEAGSVTVTVKVAFKAAWPQGAACRAGEGRDVGVAAVVCSHLKLPSAAP